MAGISTACAGRATRGLVRSRGAALALVLVAGMSLGACSVPQWANPVDWFGDDEPAPAPAAGSGAAATQASAERFPNLGRVPPRPVEVTSEGERRRALDTLAADRDNARHTDQELRARPADSNTPPPAPRAPVTPMPGPSADPGPQPAAPAAAPRQQLAPAQQTAQQQQPVTLQPPAPTAPQVQAPGQGRASAPTGNVTDAYSQSLAQSSANTLPPNLAQATMQPSSVAGAPGAVGLPGARTLLAVIRFGNGDTGLGSDDRNLVRRVAEYYKGTAGGNGSLAVVGFASSRTSDMEPSAHRQLNYSLSQKRAEAVAAELRRRGVAADKVRAEARADAAPVYYEAMPRAEDYNRRVEIYLVN